VLWPLYAFALKLEKNRSLGDVIGVLGLTDRPGARDSGQRMMLVRRVHNLGHR
jgi:hypothetical protein